MRRLADASYRILLHAFPRDFRDRHGAAMTAEFARQRAAVGVCQGDPGGGSRRGSENGPCVAFRQR
jgi:hypothetical protein